MGARSGEGMQTRKTPSTITVIRQNLDARDDNRHVRRRADVLRRAAMSSVAGV